MTLRAQEVTEQHLAEHIKQNPQNIWELFPRDKKVVEEVDQQIQQGELLESEAEELVRNETEEAQSAWVAQTSRELVDFIVAFETGSRLKELLRRIKRGDEKAALALAAAIDPEAGTPEDEALTEISRLCRDDGAFLSALAQAREQARKKEGLRARRKSAQEESLSTERLIDIFFWIKFNTEWLREELGSQEAAYAALMDHFGADAELPDADAFRDMLRLLGVEL